MHVETGYFSVQTNGKGTYEITDEIQRKIDKCGLRSGTVTVFVGLGTPAAVLLKTTRKIIELLGNDARLYVVDPADRPAIAGDDRVVLAADDCLGRRPFISARARVLEADGVHVADVDRVQVHDDRRQLLLATLRHLGALLVDLGVPVGLVQEAPPLLVAAGGAHERMPAFMWGLDLFVNPSRSESFGVAALEAGASGLP